ncbi:MAG: chemotaxis protein CheW [Holosporales bacterium]|jgi:purine-binding chemotaxis protein CheW|nr:chemotaxis protein CheW [Holosporales bacterium]
MADATKQIMSFYVNELFLAIDVSFLHDVLGVRKCNQVPLASPGIGGIINLRGNIVTVLDVDNITKSHDQPNERPYNIVFDFNAELYSLAVDKIGEFINIAGDKIDPIPSGINPAVTAIASGVLYVHDETILVLDIEKTIKLLQRGAEG